MLFRWTRWDGGINGLRAGIYGVPSLCRGRHCACVRCVFVCMSYVLFFPEADIPTGLSSSFSLLFVCGSMLARPSVRTYVFMYLLDRRFCTYLPSRPCLFISDPDFCYVIMLPIKLFLLFFALRCLTLLVFFLSIFSLAWVLCLITVY